MHQIPGRNVQHRATWILQNQTDSYVSEPPVSPPKVPNYVRQTHAKQDLHLPPNTKLNWVARPRKPLHADVLADQSHPRSLLVLALDKPESDRTTPAHSAGLSDVDVEKSDAESEEKPLWSPPVAPQSDGAIALFGYSDGYSDASPATIDPNHAIPGTDRYNGSFACNRPSRMVTNR